jgi:serine/threonine protein kinase
MRDFTNPLDPQNMVALRPDNAALFPDIPGYRFQKRLGQGGMATVYMALQESLDRPVGIKVMEREALTDETSKSRFEHEARTIARLAHPSIVSIHEVGRTADGRMYYSMSYLPNGDLAQRDLRKDEPHIVEVLRALLSALDYAHERGIVHRDVKRENVLFDTLNHPQLTDFGIALSTTETTRITTAGFAVGSSGYMAPEQARGDVVDGRADLYSVGVLAYELLTGELPFRASDPLALALMHQQSPVPRLPPERHHWQAFIDRAMAKSPSQRFDDARQMQQELDRIDRRSGNALSNRVLRTFDRTVEGKGWYRPRLLALGGALLLVIGLYAERERLPMFGTPAASVQPIAHAATNVPIAPTTMPANAPPADATPSNGSPQAQVSAPARQPSTKHAKHASAHRKPPPPPPKKRGWLSRWWHSL